MNLLIGRKADIIMDELFEITDYKHKLKPSHYLYAAADAMELNPNDISYKFMCSCLHLVTTHILDNLTYIQAKNYLMLFCPYEDSSDHINWCWTIDYKSNAAMRQHRILMLTMAAVIAESEGN